MSTKILPVKDLKKSFLDLDGHHWKILYMDPALMQPET